MQNSRKDIILLVGHGSRHQRGHAEVKHFAEQWRKRHPEQQIELCFLEFDAVTLALGLEHAGQVAQRVIVVPLMLGAATHVKKDIPQAVDVARQCFPDVRFVIASHLGKNEGKSGGRNEDEGEHVCQALLSALLQAMPDSSHVDAQDTGVVVLARGSSDVEANADLHYLADWLLEHTTHQRVDLAFTSMAVPTLENAVQKQLEQGVKQVIILPYYLFTGVLMERIAAQVQQLQAQYPHIPFALAKHIGCNVHLLDKLDACVEAVRERTYET